MKDPRPRNLIIREITKLGIGGILKRKDIVFLALNRGIPETRINKAIYELIDEEVIVIASAGIYAIRATKKEINIEPNIELPCEKALDIQIGGEHYKSMKIQPTVFITNTRLSFIQGNIIKYACRAYKKNGIQDIDKCIHYAHIGIELGNYPKMNATWNKYMKKFIDENELNTYQADIVRATCFGKWKSVIDAANKLKNVMKLQ